MIIIFIITFLWKSIPNVKRAWVFFSNREGDIPQEAIDMVDDMGVFDYSMAKLNEYNNRRE